MIYSPLQAIAMAIKWEKEIESWNYSLLTNNVPPGMILTTDQPLTRFTTLNKKCSDFFLVRIPWILTSLELVLLKHILVKIHNLIRSMEIILEFKQKNGAVLRENIGKNYIIYIYLYIKWGISA